MATWDVNWDKIRAVVQANNYGGANEEFSQIRAAVTGSSLETLAAQAGNAPLAWTFLVKFAGKKPMYRSHLVKVFKALLESPEWRSAYLTDKDLHQLVSTLHVDLQVALSIEGIDTSPAPAAAALPSVPTTKGLRWPDWETLDAIVLMSSFGNASDEFRAIQAAMKDATPDEINEQVVHAEVVWAFLIGFAGEQTYTPQISQVFKVLIAVPSWKAALMKRSDLAGSASGLHPNLVAALGLGGGSQPGLASAPAGDSEPAEAESEAEEDWEVVPTNTIKNDAAVISSQAAPPSPSAPHPLPETPSSSSSLAKRMQPYLQRAVELEDSNAIVAYYCRVYVVEQMLTAHKRGEADEEAMALVMATLDQAEGMKRALDLSGGQQHMEGFAMSTYTQAVEADVLASFGSDTDQVDAKVYTQLYVSNLFLEVLSQFYDGMLPAQMQQAANYAKSRAVHLRERMKTGSKPQLPAPPLLPEMQTRVEAITAAPQASASAPPQAPAQPPASAPTQAPDAQAFAPQPRTSAPPPTVNTQGWSGFKKQAEAKKTIDAASAALKSHNDAQARKLIIEALQLLEGL